MILKREYNRDLNWIKLGRKITKILSDEFLLCQLFSSQRTAKALLLLKSGRFPLCCNDPSQDCLENKAHWLGHGGTNDCQEIGSIHVLLFLSIYLFDSFLISFFHIWASNFCSNTFCRCFLFSGVFFQKLYQIPHGCAYTFICYFYIIYFWNIFNI